MSKADLYIGLMSGTSMDGIDASLVDFSGEFPQIIQQLEQPHPDIVKQELIALCSNHNDEKATGRMHNVLGEAFAEAVMQLLNKAGLKAADITAIGSHGQTIFHQPPANGNNGFTHQIGNPDIIREKTGITTVANFRQQDMALGGHGAPLAPAFHKAVFSHPEETRCIVNIGGIANVTLLQPGKPVTGFDTGPGNVLMDSWIFRCKGELMDRDGAWASQGKVQHDLEKLLLEEPYLAEPPPKSTGRELFNLQWLLDRLDTQDTTYAVEDVQATLAAFTAQTICNAIHQYAPETTAVYVCGGGAYNGHLMELLADDLADMHVSSTKEIGIAPDMVEAAAFAWLAKQKLEGKPGNLPEVTGASQACELGEVHN
jgi:anhydro-N-acetylmuramic acid kinase